MLIRSGVTLVELMVALVLAAIVLGTATVSSLRQQQAHASIIAATDADAQIRAATMVLAGQLEQLDPTVGDLVQGEAEDTAVQVRAPVAHSIACQREIGAATLIPYVAGAIAVGGNVAPPKTGDTLWWRPDSVWRSARIAGTNSVSATCVNGLGAGPSHQLIVAVPDTIDAGTPLRVTRQTRYAIYRASDGTYQLGVREWNDSSHRFPAPQPVAGPLLPRSGGRRTGFRYFDTGGVELVSTARPIDVTTVARMRLVMQSVVPVRSAGQDSVRVDSVDVALHHAVGH